MATNTTQYNFQKPEVGADTDAWGDMLNANWDSTDSLLRGATALSNIGIGATNTTIPLVCNAASAADITATFSGKVGIGTTSPATKLHISGDGDTNSKITVERTGATTGTNILGYDYIGTFANSELRLFTNSTEKMRITSSGNVGIGTTSPQAPLHVIGDINLGKLGNIDAANVEIASLNFYNTDTSGSAPNNAAIIRAYSHSATGSGAYLTFGTSFGGEAEGADATERMRIDASGNVGIGTSSPSTTLDVNSGLIDKVASFESTDATAYISIKDSNTTTADAHGYGANGNTLSLYSNGVRAIDVNASGKVGIGTTSPSTDLHIKNTSAAQLLIESGETATGFLLFGDASDLNIGSVSYDHSDNSMRFETDDTEKMRITSSGKVGIGTTSPDAKLDVTEAYDTVSNVLSNGSYAAKFSSSGSGATGRTQGILLSGQDGNSRGVALLAEAQSTNNAHDFVIATSGVSATPTERMRIDAAGRVGIGNTSPTSKLVVQDTNGCVSKIVATDGGSAPSATAQLKMQGYEGRGAGIFIQDSKLSASNPNDREWFIGTGYSTDSFGIGYAADGVQSHYSAQNMLTIDSSGNVLVGTTDVNATGGGFSFREGSVNYMNIAHASSVGHGNYFVAFKHDNSVIGTITKTQTTGVSYNTSSDERLKENITDSADAGSKVDAIQIRQFDWKADGSHQDYGVIAQELATVAPEAVHQPEDSEEMMGVDYSKLVPMLIKEVQSLRSRVAELENP